MMTQINQLGEADVSIQSACHAFEIPRSSYYYWRNNKNDDGAKPNDSRRQPPRTLSADERAEILAVLNSDRFVDLPPRQIYAHLLDEGVYSCSVSTMYRILADNGQVQERRNQRQHPPRPKPQLRAQAPNQLWSWDITKLRTPHKYVYVYLYVILDIFSRYVVGWMVADCESAALAQQLITDSCQRHHIGRDQLTLHSDRGAPMTALTTAQLLDKLGVQKSHSRPYTPNDNPYSESQFKTMKYRPDFPTTVDGVSDARAWARTFFDWYNCQHHHTGLALLTPADVHFGRTHSVLAQRNATLYQAYQQHPERFVQGQPSHPQPPAGVWINPPPTLTTHDEGEPVLLQ